jgi:ABC-type bacteriocin/lantibiotic exporter with double-glycine peptidase domain
MRFIRQKYLTSCGIACVAMIVGKSHETIMQKAIELFQWQCEDFEDNSRTSRKMIKILLEAFGFEGAFKSFSSWDNIEGLNLVAVRYNSKTGNWHWVVAKRDKTVLKIYDPEKDSPIAFQKNEKPDGRTYRGKWFLRIYD